MKGVESDVVYLSESPNVFIVNSSKVFGSKNMNLHPFYHDVRGQVKYLCSLIKDLEPERAITMLQDLSDKGTVSLGERKGLQFNEDVIRAAQTVLENI